MNESQRKDRINACYVFRYLRKREAIYPMVIQKDLENGFS